MKWVLECKNWKETIIPGKNYMERLLCGLCPGTTDILIANQFTLPLT